MGDEKEAPIGSCQFYLNISKAHNMCEAMLQTTRQHLALEGKPLKGKHYANAQYMCAHGRLLAWDCEPCKEKP